MVLWTLFIKTSGPKQKYYKIVWGYFKDFLVSQNCIDNRHGLLFIVLKLSVYREYIFFGTYFIIYRYVL
jgi:hypothetical protein